MATKKYRPYFTLQELKKIQEAISNASVSDLTLAGIYNYLYKYISDIEHGLRKENHVLQPSIEEKLGFSEPNQSNPPAIGTPEQLYNRWKLNQLMSPAELTIIQQYMYENDLMSPEQERDYEKSIGLSF
jgi:hypothetical protein